MTLEKQEIPFLPPGVTLTAFSHLSSDDAELIDLMKWSIKDVVAVFGEKRKKR